MFRTDNVLKLNILSKIKYYLIFDCILNSFCYILSPVFIFLQVKNKMPAPVQITAEQIIREAKERELELIEPVFYICLK